MSNVPASLWREHEGFFTGMPLTRDLREIILSLDSFNFDDEAKQILLGEFVEAARPSSAEALGKAFANEIKIGRGDIAHESIFLICAEHDWAYMPAVVHVAVALERYRTKQKRQREYQRQYRQKRRYSRK